MIRVLSRVSEILDWSQITSAPLVSTSSIGRNVKMNRLSMIDDWLTIVNLFTETVEDTGRPSETGPCQQSQRTEHDHEPAEREGHEERQAESGRREGVREESHEDDGEKLVEAAETFDRIMEPYMDEMGRLREDFAGYEDLRAKIQKALVDVSKMSILEE